MRKYIVFLIFGVVLFSLFTSCQKVIKLELNTSAPQIVIQGNVYDQPGPYTVKISKSVNFDESNVYPPVTGATVIISDNIDNSENLTETSSGTYVTSELMGVPGHSYTLTVKADSQIYIATSTMMNPVEIGSIYFKKNLFGDNLDATIDFTDLGIISNYYRLIYFVNNVQQTDINVTDNKLYEGQTITYSIVPQDTDNKLKTGDDVTIWLEAVDKGVYEYFRTAGRRGGQSASPANPTSNISNGALGYFNACSVRKIASVVP